MALLPYAATELFRIPSVGKLGRKSLQHKLFIALFLKMQKPMKILASYILFRILLNCFMGIAIL